MFQKIRIDTLKSEVTFDQETNPAIVNERCTALLQQIDRFSEGAS